MVDHIYGRINILDNRPRPHMFLKELNMYLDIFKEKVEGWMNNPDDQKEKKQLAGFKENLLNGVEYYRQLFADKKKEVVMEMEHLLSKYPAFKDFKV